MQITFCCSANCKVKDFSWIVISTFHFLSFSTVSVICKSTSRKSTWNLKRSLAQRVASTLATTLSCSIISNKPTRTWTLSSNSSTNATIARKDSLPSLSTKCTWSKLIPSVGNCNNTRRIRTTNPPPKAPPTSRKSRTSALLVTNSTRRQISWANTLSLVKRIKRVEKENTRRRSIALDNNYNVRRLSAIPATLSL